MTEYKSAASFPLDNRWPAPAAYAVLFSIYIASFRIFATLPLEAVHQVVSTLAIAAVTGYYIIRVSIDSRRGNLSRLDLLLCSFLAVNFFAAFRAWQVFGQPLIYGVFAQRTVLLCLSGVLLVSLLQRGKITVQQCERSFLILAGTLLLISYGFVLFSDPKRFVDSEFVVYSPIRGYRFRFQFAPVIMLLFYSLFKVTEEGRSRYWLLFAMIALYLLVFLQSRTTLAMLVVTLLVYLYRKYSFAQRMKRLFVLSSIFIVTISILYATGATALFDRYTVLFSNVAEAVRGGTPEEASSVIRFMELKTAFQRIVLHPFFGNGFVSSQWNGGWHKLLGYFYPADIGIFGNLFVFGIFGTIFLYLPFWFAWSLTGATSVQSVFLKTCQYSLLFFFLSMFFSAMNIRDSSTILLLVCILYYFRFPVRSSMHLAFNRIHHANT